MNTPEATEAPPAGVSERPSDRLLTIPNALCVVRLVGSPFLVLLAWADLPGWCLGLMVFLFLTDWLDGKLAILLKQRSTFGAVLDSWADNTLYLCVLLAVVLLRWDLLRGELVWIGLAVGSYALSVTAGLIKYRRVPSYHTWLAKTSWWLLFIAVIALFAEWSIWAMRVAMLGVLITNLEATLITLLLPRWRADVRSVFLAQRYRDGG